MPKPTQAEVAALVGRLRNIDVESLPAHAEQAADEAADALEALAGEGAEPVGMVIDGSAALFDRFEGKLGNETLLYTTPPAKPGMELLPLPDLKLMAHVVVARAIEDAYCSTAFKRNALKEAWEEFDRAYALRALRERA